MFTRNSKIPPTSQNCDVSVRHLWYMYVYLDASEAGHVFEVEAQRVVVFLSLVHHLLESLTERFALEHVDVASKFTLVLVAPRHQRTQHSSQHLLNTNTNLRFILSFFQIFVPTFRCVSSNLRTSFKILFFFSVTRMRYRSNFNRSPFNESMLPLEDRDVIDITLSSRCIYR